MFESPAGKFTMQLYLLLSLVPTALIAKQLTLPSSKFVLKPVRSTFQVVAFKVEELPSVISCAFLYQSAESNATLFGFNYGVTFCILSAESNTVMNGSQGHMWQTS